MTDRTTTPDARDRGGLSGPPLIVQLIALLVGALVAAQLVTLLLTLVLPPAPPREYALADVAAALRDADGFDRRFDRQVRNGPPDLSARGWFVSAAARAKLAGLLRRPVEEVALGFYTQLPVGGAVEPVAAPDRLPTDAERLRLGRIGAATAPDDDAQAFVGGASVETAFSGASGVRLMPAGLFRPTPMQQGPGGPPGGGFPGGGFPGGGSPGGGFPGGGFPGSGFPGLSPQSLPPSRPQTQQSQPQPAAAQQQQQPASAPAASAPSQPGGPAASPGQQPPALPTAPNGPPSPTGSGATQAPPPSAPLDPLRQTATAPLPIFPAVPLERPTRPTASTARAERVDDTRRDAPTSEQPAGASGNAAPAATGASDTAGAVPAASGIPDAAARSTAPAAAPPPGTPVPIVRPATGLFGLAPAPFVEGDFVAGVRLADGRWALVSPRPEGFPSAWQRRVALWFLLSLLAVTPVAWLFARRIVNPLNDFAHAADVLGRDPGAAVLPLHGPAEIGRAAHAFNQMQSRLRSFVDDRTAMIGAISHDLRTPLTRLRFRIEDAAEDQQDGLRGEVDEMEDMIASVIAFMRDASIPNARERRDLAEIVDDVVEDATLLGAVEAGRVDTAIVDVDALGIRRVLDNLLTNAMKYGGGHARVALRVEDGCAVADIVDDGPGVPDAELERIFEPFYRAESARRSPAQGSGLGLAVCRSIARAHGGDVALFRSPAGFTARVTLPLAFDDDRRAA